MALVLKGGLRRALVKRVLLRLFLLLLVFGILTLKNQKTTKKLENLLNL